MDPDQFQLEQGLPFEEYVRLFGRVLEGRDDDSDFIELAARAEALQSLERVLGADRAHSAVVVGEHGVGKTALASLKHASSGWPTQEGTSDCFGYFRTLGRH